MEERRKGGAIPRAVFMCYHGLIFRTTLSWKGNMIPGIHASVDGGPANALEILKELGLGSGQIFTSNQQMWRGRKIPDSEAGLFSAPDCPIVISHASYLANLASARPDVAAKAAKALADELLRMSKLGIKWLVLHPGAHLGQGVETGMKMISEGVRKLLAEGPEETGILFENTAGAGTTIGHSFEELCDLLDMTGMPERTGICFDTCHAYAAGYDISSEEGVNRTVSLMEKLIGLRNIRAFHMNDSMKELGSRKDRHAKAGEGLIGLEPLRYLASLDEFANVPGISEVPGSDEDRASDILRICRGQT